MPSHRVLLHICCAPDATVPLPALLAEGWDVRCAFWRANIHPEEEFFLRAQSVEFLCSEYDVPVYVGKDMEHVEFWMKKTLSLKQERERGARCGLCFAIQLELSARQAVKEGCQSLCTTLTISPHKDPALINNIGHAVSRRYQLTWIEKVWRRNIGFVKYVAEGRRLGLYRQNYCGCQYSKGGSSFE